MNLIAKITYEDLVSAKASGKKLGRLEKFEDKKRVVSDIYNYGNYLINDKIKANKLLGVVCIDISKKR